MATIRFFASVRDKTGRDSVTIEIKSPSSVGDALKMAAAQMGVNEATLINRSLRYAVNMNIEGLDFTVNDSDEIALLPPLSGG